MRLKSKKILPVAAVALVLGGIAGTLVLTALVPNDDPVLTVSKQWGWTEVQWPFALDQFGRGKRGQIKEMST